MCVYISYRIVYLIISMKCIVACCAEALTILSASRKISYGRAVETIFNTKEKEEELHIAHAWCMRVCVCVDVCESVSCSPQQHTHMFFFCFVWKLITPRLAIILWYRRPIDMTQPIYICVCAVHILYYTHICGFTVFEQQIWSHRWIAKLIELHFKNRNASYSQWNSFVFCFE